MATRARASGGDDARALRAVALAVLVALPAWAVVGPLAPAASAQGEAVANVLRNGDFERGGAWDGPTSRPSNWNALTEPPGQEGVETTHEGDLAHNGSRCVSVVRAVGEAGSTYWYQEVDALPGETLPFGAWVLAPGLDGASVEVRLRMYDRFRRPLGTVEVTLSSAARAWTELHGSVEFHVNATRVRFECVLVGDGRAWFDDAYLGTPTDMDNAPIVVSVPPSDVVLGTRYSYRARVVDLEGDTVAFSLERGPAGMSVAADGLVTWTPASMPDGAVRVVLNATDAVGRSGYQDFFLQVLPEPLARPLYAYLVSTGDDPFNLALSAERYETVMPHIEALGDQSPAMGVSVTVIMGGSEATALAQGGGGIDGGILARIREAVDAGWAEAGWSSLHEPTHDGNPLSALDYPNATWEEVVDVTADLLADGGLQALERYLGTAQAVVLLAEDGPQLHALDRWSACATVVALPPEGGAVGPHPMPRTGSDTIASMLAEDPSAPYAVYWEAGRLRIATADVGEDGCPVVAAREGAAGAGATLDALDARRSWVVPVLVMDTGMYCNGSYVMDGQPVVSPADWGYANPQSPRLPAPAVRSAAQRAALAEATNGTLDWLVEDALPSRGGRFLSTEALRTLLDDGAGRAVSAAELQVAAADLLARRTDLAYPYWDGVQWGFCRGDYRFFSLADAYGLLVRALSAYDADGALPAAVGPLELQGPMEGRPSAFPWQSVLVSEVVAEASRQASALVDASWRVTPRATVPSSCSPGGTEANAMEFLLLMAEAYLALYERAASGGLVSLLSTRQWPLTLRAMESEGDVRFPGISWTVRPASATGSMDTVPPTVLRVEPAPASRAVPLATNVTVSFTERMDESVPLDGALVLEPPVAGEVRWIAHRLVLAPAGPLLGNTTYVARAGGGLRDVAGNALSVPFVWNFTTVGTENLDPVLRPSPNVTRLEVLENGTLRFSVEVDDDGPPPLSYRWVLDGATMRGETGATLVYSPGYADEGEHRITVVVQDAADPPGAATHSWTVEVVNVNLVPQLVRTEPADRMLIVSEGEGAVLALRVVAVDPDEGSLTYAWDVDGAPPDAGALSEGGAALAFAHGFDSAGEHAVACRVRDRQGVGFDVTWSVVVEDVNRPPVVLGTDPVWTTSVEVGRVARLRVNATDPDGDALEFRWHVDGTEAARTRAGDWNYTSQRVGVYAVNVTVLDGRGGVAEATFLVDVLPSPDRPDPGGDDTPWTWVVLFAVALVAVVAFVAWTELRRRRGGA